MKKIIRKTKQAIAPPPSLPFAGNHPQLIIRKPGLPHLQQIMSIIRQLSATGHCAMEN